MQSPHLTTLLSLSELAAMELLAEGNFTTSDSKTIQFLR